MKKTSSIIWFAAFSVVTILLSQLPAVDAQTGDTWAVDANNNVVTAVGTENVGIRTTNPDLPLTVQAKAGSTAWLRFRDSSAINKFHISGLNGGFNIAESGVIDGRLYLKPGGAAGINTTSPFGGTFSGNGLDINGILKVGGQGFNEATTGAGGMMYYNGTKFRCNEGGSWKDCVVGGGSGGGIGNDAPSPNALPRWTSTGNAFLTNSNISDNGTQVTISKPTSITGSLSASSITVTGGSPTVCQAGQVLAGATVRGGLVTGGTCSSFISSTPGFSLWEQIPGTAKLKTSATIDAIGVGTSDVDLPLTIKGGGQSGSAWIRLKDSTGANKWHFTGFGGGFSFVETGVAGGDGRFFIKAGSGNVGMGTITPGAKLEISTPTSNALRLRRGTPGSVDVFSAVGSGTGNSLCGVPTAGACLAAFDSSRSSISCSEGGAIRALCAAVGD